MTRIHRGKADDGGEDDNVAGNDGGVEDKKALLEELEPVAITTGRNTRCNRSKELIRIKFYERELFFSLV